MSYGSCSVSGIQEYTEFVTKMYKALTAIPPIYVYINRINNILVFKEKDGYKLELHTLETMKLFGSTKKLIGEKVPSLEVVEVVLVQFNLVDNQY